MGNCFKKALTVFERFLHLRRNFKILKNKFS
jgi:hypothetical protein